MIAVWDSLKAAANIRKHGIRFTDAEAVLFDPLAVNVGETEVDGETRLIVAGTDHLGRVLVVVYTLRGDSVRLISARRATREERMNYEEGI